MRCISFSNNAYFTSRVLARRCPCCARYEAVLKLSDVFVHIFIGGDSPSLTFHCFERILTTRRSSRACISCLLHRLACICYVYRLTTHVVLPIELCDQLPPLVAQSRFLRAPMLLWLLLEVPTAGEQRWRRFSQRSSAFKPCRRGFSQGIASGVPGAAVRPPYLVLFARRG